jgi:hypothetical protein
MEVPWKFANPVPGVTDELIKEPGASNDRIAALLEKEETTSNVAPPDPSPVEPTLTDVEIQAGEAIALVKPSFPDAIAVAIPADLRRSITGFMALLSQDVKF